jgi:hypothetical protein
MGTNKEADAIISHWLSASEDAAARGDSWQAAAFMRTANLLIVEHYEP